MALTFLDLTNDVLKRLNEVLLSPSDFNTNSNIHLDSQNAVNAAINKLYRDPFRWPFQCKKVSLTLEEGNNTYPIPDNSKHIAFDTFRIKRDNNLNVNGRRLRWMDYEEFLEQYSDRDFDTDTGIPEFVVRNLDLTFTVYPTPDKPYEVIYDHYEYPSPLVEWDDEINLPDFFRWVIHEGAMYHAFTFRGALEEAAASNALFEDGIKDMRTLYVNRYEYVRSSQIRR